MVPANVVAPPKISCTNESSTNPFNKAYMDDMMARKSVRMLVHSDGTLLVNGYDILASRCEKLRKAKGQHKTQHNTMYTMSVERPYVNISLTPFSQTS